MVPRAAALVYSSAFRRQYETIEEYFLRILVGAAVCGLPPAFAQSFQTYRCADKTQFILGFYPSDSRAYVQIDGREVPLPRRLTLPGSRYSGADVTLKMTSAGAITIKHANRREA